MKGPRARETGGRELRRKSLERRRFRPLAIVAELPFDPELEAPVRPPEADFSFFDSGEDWIK